MTLAGALAYYAGQIIFDPSVATLVGLRPLAHVVSMCAMGWACMTCALVTAVSALGRSRCWWADRLGFATATFPMLMWATAFTYSWIDREFEGYPPGGTWFFFAAMTTVANLKLDRGPRISTEERR
jgi:hypothetical protein